MTLSNRRWLLPEAVADALPNEAVRIEALRRRLLDEFAAQGYELVIPPLLEYAESLLAADHGDLDLRTFKLVDQMSGRGLGVRADTTPQVARIDAHMLNRAGVARLCYCGSVLHTLPASFAATREPLQLGAELYGHAGLEADIEIVGLLVETLRLAGIAGARLDFGHAGIFHALLAQAGLDGESGRELLAAMQGKDVPTLQALLADVGEPWRSALLALPDLHGDSRMLNVAAARLPATPEITAALDDLQRMAAAFADAAPGFDLADLRSYDYHTGVVFAAYGPASAGALALGGRYDGLGAAYGRARPATGFSLDLRELARLASTDAARGAILADWPLDEAARAEVRRLRAAGERVLLALPGHAGTWREAGCDRVLTRRDDQWAIEPLKED
jgi:ATP phosphoribosyltransferase regulatory subunit